MGKISWDIINRREKNEPLSSEQIISLLLANRGINKKKDTNEFLHPDLALVSFESTGINISQVERSITRLQQAINKKEGIIVFGDYDVDGITGSAILWETLHEITQTVLPYIPHRIDEGYGLSVRGIENVLHKYPNTKVIITVDNGIVAHDAVLFAKEKGIDVIITDHHMPQEGEESKQPDAYAIVHTTKLCGAGVAYLFSNELRKKLLKKTSSITDDAHLELAALGTIADMVPLTFANRTLAYYGLKSLARTTRPGLQALYKEALIDPSMGISSYHVGHMIAPRLNAAGRLESAMDSLRLLCTKNTTRARELAYSLSQINKQRQEFMRDSALHAIEQVRKVQPETKNILILAHESYKEGVIGLIAGKLVEEFYRPAIVISKREKHSKASVRSIKGFNIIEFLRAHSTLFVNVGGHPMAAGFTVQTEQIEELVLTLETSAKTFVTDSMLKRSLAIDAELLFQEINDDLYKQLDSLAPFGVGNREPLFLTQNVSVDDFRVIGKEGTHLKLKVSTGINQFDAIAFGLGARSSEIEIGSSVDIVYSIDENIWNGKRSLQLKVKDFKKIN